jgi:hypothetical protein
MSRLWRVLENVDSRSMCLLDGLEKWKDVNQIDSVARFFSWRSILVQPDHLNCLF